MPLTRVTGNLISDSTITNADISASAAIDASKLAPVTATGSTTARTLANRFADVVNVKDFGAVGDGVTDDTAAIQAAINTGTNIFIPVGIYKITSNLILTSNRQIFGVGNATKIQISSNNIKGFTVLTSVDNNSIIIRDLLIDGGGQTTNIYTGYKGGEGIYISRCKNLLIENVTIQNMGVVKSSIDPTDDNGYGGYGIMVESRHGDINNIRINNCTVKNIAGGGNAAGDGIYIAGFSAGSGVDYVDAIVSKCWVSTCGRHCYTVAGGAGETTPSGVVFRDCYGEKSASDWLDIEEGNDIVVDGCTIAYCGNDQTYYNPVAQYGPTYRLLAGIATGGDSKNIVINNCIFRNNYYGITYGTTDGLVISNSTFSDSTISDLSQGLASGAYNFSITNCIFKTISNNLSYYANPSANNGVSVNNSYFYGTLQLIAMSDGIFSNCTFKRGVSITGGLGYFKRNKFIGCTFSDWAGIGFKCDGANGFHPDNIIDSCIFNGSGNMTIGIAFGYDSAFRWKIDNCKFIGCTTAGIQQANGNNGNTFDITNCHFDGCSHGIKINQSVKDCLISGNYFRNITSWCFLLDNIISGADMSFGPTIVNNKSGDSCVNGLQIGISTGSYNYTIIMGNNFRSCSGTKWSLSPGNANGIVANNITA